MNDPVDFAIAAALVAIVAVAWPSLVKLVEEWSHETKQTDSRATADAVAADVVRRRKRRPSISPWVK